MNTELTELTLAQLAAIGAGAAQFSNGNALIGNLTVHPTRSGYAGDQPFREAFARAVRDAALGNQPTPKTVNPIEGMALGGQMYWRDLAIQLAKVWWACHSIGASLQHGNIDNDVTFTVCCELHGGRCFHAHTPHDAWWKAEKWLMSPDRENFPALDAAKGES